MPKSECCTLKIVSLIMLLYDGALTKVSVLQAEFYVRRERGMRKVYDDGHEKLAYLYFCESWIIFSFSLHQKFNEVGCASTIHSRLALYVSGMPTSWWGTMSIGGTVGERRKEREGNVFFWIRTEARSSRLTINAQLYSLRDTWRNSILNLNKGIAKGNGEKWK